MTSAAIYARFSTDKQSETSIDDQARICRKRAEALDVTSSPCMPTMQSVAPRAWPIARVAAPCWPTCWHAGSRF